MNRLQTAIEFLAELVSYETVVGDSNLELIEYAAGYLSDTGARVTLVTDPEGRKANAFATFGPDSDGGIVLSGHTDVVPVDGQVWEFDPFIARVTDGRVYGRGTADMKGFIACVLAMAPEFSTWNLGIPIHVALTYDEEVGCLGAQTMLDHLARSGPKPAIAIVGEPTEHQIIDAHKGCYEYTTEIRGLEGHASLPDQSVSAIHAAMRFISKLSDLQTELRELTPTDSIFNPPYTTINVGTIEGGVARNITAGSTVFDWEMRPVRAADAVLVLTQLEQFVEAELLPEMRAIFPEAEVNTATIGAVGGLEPVPGSAASRLVAELVGHSNRSSVSFGTEAGLYQQMGISAVVWGPGNIDQAHTPDEFIEISQLDECLTMLERLRPLVEQPPTFLRQFVPTHGDQLTQEGF